MRSRLLLLGAIVAAAGCGGRPNVTGTATVDGKPAEFSTCFAGPTHGFFGVELVTTTGAHVRLVYDPKGEAIAYLFEPGAKLGIELGDCGPMEIVNMHLAHAHGSATLRCTSNGHSIEAQQLAFRDCEYVR